MSAFQCFANINDKKNIEFPFTASNNIIFEYLMPETEMKIILFINDSIREGEKLNEGYAIKA